MTTKSKVGRRQDGDKLKWPCLVKGTQVFLVFGSIRIGLDDMHCIELHLLVLTTVLGLHLGKGEGG